MANLLIIESPTKAHTIQSFLGSGYKVIASQGHVRDLPKSTLGIDIENNFEAHYINIRGKGELISDLKKAAKAATKVYLATDADREGEAISWHLANALGIPIDKTRRITFNEVTKSAVTEGIKNPRNINMELVDSQQARRLLDRIVGYKLSPFLWKTVRGGLSAGRVQSVATRIIVEREEQINAFVPVEYWTISATHTNRGGIEFSSKFYGTRDKKSEISSKEQADEILSKLDGKPFIVESVKTAVKHRNPAPPFTTSTMQQDAAKKLGFQTQRIMRVAQELYEGINVGAENGGTLGLITYMRTDSLRIAAEAQDAAREYIAGHYGEKYLPEEKRVYKTKSDAQDAHEAIRPSRVALDPKQIKKYLSLDQYRLYKLIWERFVASQMESAEYDTSSADISCAGYIFKANGQNIRFKGFLAVYDEKTDEDEEASKLLPTLEPKEHLKNNTVSSEQHFTEPPARFSEATLVHFLEEKGIGRPSTYAPIITTIIARGYVSRDGKSLKPTQLGIITTNLMKEYFPDIVDYAFTAQMENELDSVASGEQTLTGVLSEFYGKFKISLEDAEKNAPSQSALIPDEEADMVCDKCGAKMIIKSGRFGKFAACPNYPQCKNTKPLISPDTKEKEAVKAEATDLICEKCGSPMLLRVGKFGKFYACSAFPKCRNIVNSDNKIDVPCPKCGGEILKKVAKGKSVFYSCSNYPKCDFSSWNQPISQKCPDCGNIMYIKKNTETPVCCCKTCVSYFGKKKNDKKD